MSSSSSPSSNYSYNSSLLVIATLLAFVIAFTITIHLILRLLARLSSTPSPSLNHHNSPNSFISSASSATTNSNTNTLDPSRKSLIDSFPLFTLASLPPLSSATCSICLSHFTADDKLRLLPACRHMFHSICIDTWLRSTPSCPLCRSSVQVQRPEAPAGTPVQQQGQGQGQRQAQAVEEEATRVSWLKEYVDRLALSASSSFSSMRLSSWGSRRFDGDVSGRMELGESFRSGEISTGYFASSFKWILEGAA